MEITTCDLSIKLFEKKKKEKSKFEKKENMQSGVVIWNLHNEIDSCNFDYKDIEGVYGYNIQQNLLPQNPHKPKNWNNTMEIEEINENDKLTAFAKQ